MTDVREGKLYAIHTATQHLLTREFGRIVDWSGDRDMSSYLSPLVVRLSAKMCWDRTELWFESFEEFAARAHRSRRLRRQFVWV